MGSFQLSNAFKFSMEKHKKSISHFATGNFALKILRCFDERSFFLFVSFPSILKINYIWKPHKVLIDHLRDLKESLRWKSGVLIKYINSMNNLCEPSIDLSEIFNSVKGNKLLGSHAINWFWFTVLIFRESKLNWKPHRTQPTHINHLRGIITKFVLKAILPFTIQELFYRSTT